MLEKIRTDLNFTQDCINPFAEENKNLWVKLEHLGRYLFAVDYLRRFNPVSVADIACGYGYGLPVLNQITELVIGVDSNTQILKQASKQFHNCDQICLLEHDLEQSNSLVSSFKSTVDAIVSFETLEHLIDPAIALKQFFHLLRSGGFLICSVPNVLYEPLDAAGLPTNPYHKQLFNCESFSHLLVRNGFRINYRLGQARANILFKQESKLLKHRTIQQRIGDYYQLHDPEILRHLSYLIAYPTVEDVDGSYTLIVVAQKTD